MRGSAKIDVIHSGSRGGSWTLMAASGRLKTPDPPIRQKDVCELSHSGASRIWLLGKQCVELPGHGEVTQKGWTVRSWKNCEGSQTCVYSWPKPAVWEILRREGKTRGGGRGEGWGGRKDGRTEAPGEGKEGGGKDADNVLGWLFPP